MPRRPVSIAYTPDSDDAFYYYALQCQRIPTRGSTLTFSVDHIIALNRAARASTYDITAVSSVAYPALAKDYRILSVGTSVGRGYGPVLVSRDLHSLDDLRGKRVGVAGLPTTGGFLARWACPDAELVEMQFDRIATAVQKGQLDAGVMIHEELLFFKELGLHCVADLGGVWTQETGLPLPVGLNIIRRDFSIDASNRLCDLLRASLLFALQHHDEALEWASNFGRGKEAACGETHISMFANSDSVMMPHDVRIALAHIFQLTHDMAITTHLPPIDIIEGSPVSVEQAVESIA